MDVIYTLFEDLRKAIFILDMSVCVSVCLCVCLWIAFDAAIQDFFLHTSLVNILRVAPVVDIPYLKITKSID